MPRRPGSIDVDQINFTEAVSQNVVFSGSVKMANLGPKGNTLIIDADGQVSGSDFITIDSENNRIGVFTRTPQEAFHIHGNNATLRLGNGTNSGEHSVKLELSEQANADGDMNYGFSVGYNGASNDFEVRRYQNGTAGTNIMTINRASNLTTLRNDLDVGGTVDITGSLSVTGSIYTSNNISFVDKNGTFPTNAAGFFWALNNDEARIYAKQPASDEIDFVFKLSDNNNSVDRYLFWIDDYRGGSYDRFPLMMHGEGVFFQMTQTSEGVPNVATSRARFDSSGRLAFNCQNQTDPSLLLNHAHIYSKLDSGTAEMFVRDSDGNVTKISPHNSKGEWEYFSRNTETGKVVRVNMEKMIRKLEEITGESFMEEWYEEPE